MKIRTTILSAALAGGLSVSQGAGVYAAGGLAEPVDEVPGTVTIDQIDLGANNFTVTYNDTGTDVDKVIRLLVGYINDGREMAEGDWTKITYYDWMTRLYDKSIYDDNSAQLLSGQSDVIGQNQYYFNWSEVGNISPGKLYYGVETVMEGNDSVVRYAMGEADYRGCLAKYKEMDGMAMITCKPETKASGKVIYAPYMGEVRLEMDAQYERDDEPVEPDPDPTPDPEPDPDPTPDPDPDPTPNPDPEPTPNPDPEPSNPDPTPGPEETDNSGTIENGTENGGGTTDNGSSNGNGSNTDNSTVTVATADTTVDNSATDGGVVTANYTVAENFGFWPAESGELADGEGEAEAQPEITVTGEGATSSQSEAELPDLGGGEEQSKGNGLIWWALIPLLVGGVGVSWWWIVPALSGKKSQKR